MRSAPAVTRSPWSTTRQPLATARRSGGSRTAATWPAPSPAPTASPSATDEPFATTSPEWWLKGGALERRPVGLGSRAHLSGEMVAQRRRIAEAAAVGDRLDAELGVLEQPAGQEQPLRGQPIVGRRAGL